MLASRELPLAMVARELVTWTEREECLQAPLASASSPPTIFLNPRFQLLLLHPRGCKLEVMGEIWFIDEFCLAFTMFS